MLHLDEGKLLLDQINAKGRILVPGRYVHVLCCIHHCLEVRMYITRSRLQLSLNNVKIIFHKMAYEYTRRQSGRVAPYISYVYKALPVMLCLSQHATKTPQIKTTI